jgi:hypothetical protein
MSFADPTIPNLADFITFCQAQGLQPAFLPVSSPYYQWALTHAVNTVYTVPEIPGIEYVIATYNYGMHWLVSNAPDISGQTITAMTWSGGAVIVTPAVPVDVMLGSTFGVTIGAVLPLTYNGAFQAQAISSSTFAYPMESNPGAVVQQGVFGFTFFADLRKQFKLLALVAGPVQTTADQGTSTTLAVADFFKNATMSDIDLMKTPWGQRYMAYAQKAGPTVVGVS